MATDFFFEKQPQEIVGFDIDFVDKLDSGVTISSATIIVWDEDGNDVSSTILNGGETIIAGRDSTITKVVQQVKGGSHGDKYLIEILATASDGSKPEEDIELKIKKKGYR